MRRVRIEKYDISQPINLKKGVYILNDEANFNYQLNRVINWDGGRLEDVQRIGEKIKSNADWKRELLALGNEAMTEDHTENAIAYYRMSEFFMYDGDPDKKNCYKKATALFYAYYADYFEGENHRINQFEVPYVDVKLPVMHVNRKEAARRHCFFTEGMIAILRNFCFPCCICKKMDLRYIFLKDQDRAVLFACRECILRTNGKSRSK